MITAFKPDLIEVSELLDALLSCVHSQFNDVACEDVEHEARQLKEALKELDGKCCELSFEDEAYDNYRARYECD